MIRGEPEHREPLEGKPTAGEEAAGSCRRMTGVASIACHKRSGQGKEAIDQRGRTGTGSTVGEEAGEQPRWTMIVEEHVRRDVCKRAKRMRSWRAAVLQVAGGSQFETEDAEAGADRRYAAVAVQQRDSVAQTARLARSEEETGPRARARSCPSVSRGEAQCPPRTPGTEGSSACPGEPQV